MALTAADFMKAMQNWPPPPPQHSFNAVGDYPGYITTYQEQQPVQFVAPGGMITQVPGPSYYGYEHNAAAHTHSLTFTIPPPVAPTVSRQLTLEEIEDPDAYLLSRAKELMTEGLKVMVDQIVGQPVQPGLFGAMQAHINALATDAGLQNVVISQEHVPVGGYAHTRLVVNATLAATGVDLHFSIDLS